MAKFRQIWSHWSSNLKKVGQPGLFFICFRFFKHNISEKTVGFSGIGTWIVGVEGEHADHLTTTTARVGFFYLYRILGYKYKNFRNSFSSLLQDLVKHQVVGLHYFVPASLYCLYNNLAFQNLSFFDPTTYFIFMQIRLLMTGIIYQVRCFNLL